MTQRPILPVKPNYVASYRQGRPLVKQENIAAQASELEDGTLFDLVDHHHSFIAVGYYGRQNKGLGWLLTWRRNETIDQAFFKKKLSAALNVRHAFFNDTTTTAFRVFNGEGDGIGGLTIDYFAGFYLINWYSEGVYTFKTQVIEALDELVEYEGIYDKKRFDTKGHYINDDDFVTGTRGDFPIIVQENGMHYAVDLNDGAMVGVFLDQREVRLAIQQHYAKAQHVLNTFSYTGAFSVAALYGGASKTTNVDLAKRSQPKTIEQFSVNGFDYEAQDIVVMDVFDYFKYAKRKNLSFGMVILDPPSFARSKKRTFKVTKDYPELIQAAIALTEKNGIIVASTNNGSIHMKTFKQFVHKAFRDTSSTYKILQEFSLPADYRVNRHYPEGDYLKVIILRKTQN